MEFHARPFDVETTFENAVLARKRQTKKCRGLDSPLYSTIYPMVCITKFFGLAPYDFSRDQLVPSNFCLIFSILVAAIYCYVMYTVLLRFTGLKRDRPVLGGTETAKVVFNYAVAMYEIVLAVFSRRTFTRIWNELQDYDDSVRLLGYPRRESRTGIAAWIVFILQTIIWTVVNQTGMYAFCEPWVNNISYMSIYIGSAVSVFKFIGVTYFLGQRFHDLNEIARTNLPPILGNRNTNLSKKTIQKLHNELMIIGEALNSLYSWSLFFWLGNLSMHSVSNLYFIIDWALLTPWSEISWPLITCLSSWLFAFLVQLLMLHIVCEYASSEANSMGAILLEWNVRLNKRIPQDDYIGISLTFLNRKLNFSAGGCFNVNFSLLRSIAALLSTYLVLLLQFSD